MRRLSAVALLCTLVCVATGAHAQNSCVFTVSMLSGTDVTNLDFRVSYPTTNVDIDGTANNPKCARALGGASFAAFHDDDTSHKVSVSLIRLAPFSAPVPLVACQFFYEGNQPVPASFGVTVTNAGSGGGDNNVVPTPNIQVTRVDCPGTLPTPTTTTTTLDITTTTLAGSGNCGFPVSNGDKPNVTDALAALKAAIGLRDCDLCVCDVDSSGTISAADALTILRAAVSSGTTLDCPPC